MYAYWKGFSIQHGRGIKLKAKCFSFSPLDSQEGGDMRQAELKETLKLSFLSSFTPFLSVFFKIASEIGSSGWSVRAQSWIGFTKIPHTSMELNQTYIFCPVWLSHTNIFTQIEDSLERVLGVGNTHISQDYLSSPTAFYSLQYNTGIKQLVGYDILTQEEAEEKDAKVLGSRGQQLQKWMPSPRENFHPRRYHGNRPLTPSPYFR